MSTVMRSLSHRATAYFQAILTLLFLWEYFQVLHAFLGGYAKPPSEWKDTIIALLGVLTGSVLTIITFWFNRQRVSDPNPNGQQGGGIP